jgi:hypothetical protein
MSYYIHSVPGRLRVKTPTIKGNQERGLDVECLVNGCFGVTKTAANPLTGSIVVHYDHKTVSEKSIVNLLENTGYFKADQAQTHDQYIHDVTSKAGHLVWNAVFGSFVGAALEGTPLAVLSVLV